MAQGSRSNRVLVREATRALDQFKYEVASEIGVNPPASGYWGDLASRDCGAVGGHMVRRMIQQAEQQLAAGQAAAPAATFGRFGSPQ
ncbi:MAG: alpha/beta-type small acid-soluble spore protein [Clostridia bacterium]|nr:alpha/beta-type small acid-soluble spore protein [Clostridia bacterium]MCL6521798.1 alpha/beta-type small acid-soluble spore protein [Bacillota bacterium]